MIWLHMVNITAILVSLYRPKKKADFISINFQSETILEFNEWPNNPLLIIRLHFARDIKRYSASATSRCKYVLTVQCTSKTSQAHKKKMEIKSTFVHLFQFKNQYLLHFINVLHIIRPPFIKYKRNVLSERITLVICVYILPNILHILYVYVIDVSISLREYQRKSWNFAMAPHHFTSRSNP